MLKIKLKIITKSVNVFELLNTFTNNELKSNLLMNWYALTFDLKASKLLITPISGGKELKTLQ